MIYSTENNFINIQADEFDIIQKVPYDLYAHTCIKANGCDIFFYNNGTILGHLPPTSTHTAVIDVCKKFAPTSKAEARKQEKLPLPLCAFAIRLSPILTRQELDGSPWRLAFGGKINFFDSDYNTNASVFCSGSVQLQIKYNGTDWSGIQTLIALHGEHGLTSTTLMQPNSDLYSFILNTVTAWLQNKLNNIQLGGFQKTQGAITQIQHIIASSLQDSFIDTLNYSWINLISLAIEIKPTPDFQAKINK